jgi:asparagine synthase (glutamine-hydrolysing)
MSPDTHPSSSFDRRLFRFIGLVWDEANELLTETAALLSRRIEAAAPGWRCATSFAGLEIHCSAERVGVLESHLLPGNGGTVLGTVFHPLDGAMATSTRKKVFSAADVESLQRTHGRSLVDLCWGRYVAFIRDRGSHTVHIVRDPTGGLPCYHTSFAGVNVFFSSVEDVLRLGLLRFEVDWRYIAARVASPALIARDTALEHVTELLPGEKTTVNSRGVDRTFAWNPLLVAATDPIEDPREAAYEMRRAAYACIHAWASLHPTILHMLSGGLDSAIVLAGLSRAPHLPRVVCLNQHSPGCDGDERSYARLAVLHNHCTLVERRRSEQVDLAGLLDIERSCVPTFYLNTLQSGREIADLAQEIGATAVFGGGGGDQLFYQTQAVLAAADWLMTHGPGRGYFKVALDTARLARLSIWSVMMKSMSLALRASSHRPWNDATGMRKLTGANVSVGPSEQARFVHPLFESIRRTLPGKLFHAWSLAIPQEFYDPRPGRPEIERIQPLISQPLIETCLRIPTYVMTNDGWDRSIARQAFRDELPPEIRRRRSKGGMDDNALVILMRNLEVARDLLVNGHLVARGLLDRDAVTQVLSGEPTHIAGAMAEIFDHLSVEAWLRRWHPIPSRSRCEQALSSLAS